MHEGKLLPSDHLCFNKLKQNMVKCRDENVRKKINFAICVSFSVLFTLILLTFYFNLVYLNMT